MGKVVFHSVGLEHFVGHLDEHFSGEFAWNIDFLGITRFVLISETQLAYLKYEKRYQHVKSFKKLVDREARLSDRMVADVLWELACDEPQAVKPSVFSRKQLDKHDYMELPFEDFKEDFHENLFDLYSTRTVVVTDPCFKCNFYLFSDQAFGFQTFVTESQYDKEFKARLKRSIEQSRKEGGLVSLNKSFCRVDESRKHTII